MNKNLITIFHVQEDTTGQYLYVDVAGRGTVCIKAEDEGIVVDIFPLHVADEAIASTFAHINDLVEEPKE